MSFADSGHDRFTDWLRERSEPTWTEATGHRFTEELAAGTIDDDVFRAYLVQDYRFVETLVRVVGYAAGQAPSPAEATALAEFLTAVGTDETDYFERSFDALDVPAGDRTDPELWDVTAAFEDLLLRGAHEGGYAETLSVLVPVEWAYLTWGERAAAGDRPDAFYLDEWIDLHAVEAFRETVAWLREQLDAAGAALDPAGRRRVARNFERAVELEVRFFDAAYE